MCRGSVRKYYRKLICMLSDFDISQTFTCSSDIGVVLLPRPGSEGDQDFPYTAQPLENTRKQVPVCLGQRLKVTYFCITMGRSFSTPQNTPIHMMENQ